MITSSRIFTRVYLPKRRNFNDADCEISNDCFYLKKTSPNKREKLAIKKDGYISCRRNGISRLIGTVKDVFAGDDMAAAIDQDDRTWIWGNCPWNNGGAILMLEKQTDPIMHIDFSNMCIIMVTRSGKIHSIIEEYSKHTYDSAIRMMDAIDNVLMTSSWYSNDGSHRSHTMILSKNGYITCFGSNESGECMVPESNCFSAVEASNGLSAALRSDGSVLLWGNVSGKKEHTTEWSCPWKLSKDNFLRFFNEYGHAIKIRRIPRWIKRIPGYQSTRIMQRMINS